MFKERPLHVLLFCSVITICTAVLQYIYPDFNFVDGGLITAILMTVFLKKSLYTYLFGCIGIALVIVSAFYPHDALTTQQNIMQHLFSGIIALLTMVSVLYVKKLYGSIEAEQQQVNALFEHATEGILLTNQQGEIILANPAALSLFGYTKDELLNKKIEVLIPSRFLGGHHQYREGFYHKPSNRAMGHGRDLYARKNDGLEFPVEVSLSYYQQQGAFYVIAFVVDITQRKESELRLIEQKQQLQQITSAVQKLNAELETKVEERTLILKEALEELERSQSELSEALNKEKELNEIKSRFVSMASHEFRTPLSTVLSSASLIARYGKAEEQEQRERHVKRIKDSVAHLNELLEDFLSLGKLDEGKVDIHPVLFEVKPFLEDIADEMKGLLKEGQQINTICDGVPDNFVTDKKLFRNILINLLGNAIKFSSKPVVLKAGIHNERLQIAVQDEGIGIAVEDQQHLFSSFFRGKNALNIQGTGLGLHIVKRYADMLQGTVQLESEVNKGTTITIELPMLGE
ncbi:MAG: ATP-binding protein [Chitinophagaceae bacterium]